MSYAIVHHGRVIAHSDFEHPFPMMRRLRGIFRPPDAFAAAEAGVRPYCVDAPGTEAPLPAPAGLLELRDP